MRADAVHKLAEFCLAYVKIAVLIPPVKKLHILLSLLKLIFWRPHPEEIFVCPFLGSRFWSCVQFVFHERLRVLVTKCLGQFLFTQVTIAISILKTKPRLEIVP